MYSTKIYLSSASFRNGWLRNMSFPRPASVTSTISLQRWGFKPPVGTSSGICLKLSMADFNISGFFDTAWHRFLTVLGWFVHKVIIESQWKRIIVTWDTKARGAKTIKNDFEDRNLHANSRAGFEDEGCLRLQKAVTQIHDCTSNFYTQGTSIRFRAVSASTPGGKGADCIIFSKSWQRNVESEPSLFWAPRKSCKIEVRWRVQWVHTQDVK